MASMRAVVKRVAAASPDDVSGVEALFDAGLDLASVVAVLGKTEGNGCVNDFTRGFATRCFEDLFARRGAGDVAIVMSGGTEGALSPHWTVFAREASDEEPTRALAVGIARTADLAPEDLGRRGQVEMVAEGVAKAMADARVETADDVHFVQVKCPLLTAARVEEASRRGVTTATGDTLKSMGLSRGASALGVGSRSARSRRTRSGTRTSAGTTGCFPAAPRRRPASSSGATRSWCSAWGRAGPARSRSTMR
nr:CHL1-atzD [Chenggangzhangella methanolivorans]